MILNKNHILRANRINCRADLAPPEPTRFSPIIQLLAQFGRAFFSTRYLPAFTAKNKSEKLQRSTDNCLGDKKIIEKTK